MVDLIPIDASFVPHNKRAVLRRNAALFVDSTGGGRSAAGVVLQAAECRPGGGLSGDACCVRGPDDEGKACQWSGTTVTAKCDGGGSCQPFYGSRS
jgi:hypothetical protein